MRLLARELLGRRWFMPALLGAVTLAMFVLRLPAAPSFEDSAEFVSAAATLGLPHPSGYPLYVLLAHVFSWLPFGTVPWRVALLSAVAAAGAAVMLFVAARLAFERLAARRAELREEAVAVLALLQLSFGVTWFSQAVMAEVYALHAFFVAAIVLALVCERVRALGLRGTALIALLYGLACANHFYLAAVSGPFLLAALAYRAPADFRRVQTWAACAGAFALGLLPYALVPWLSQHGGYVYRAVSGAGETLQMLARSSYGGDIGTGGFNRFAFWVAYGRQLLNDLLPAVLFASVYGLWRGWRSAQREVRALLLWLAGPLLAVPMIAFIYTADYSAPVAYVYKVYALGGLAAAAFAGALGLMLFMAGRGRRQWKAMFLLLSALACFTLLRDRAEIAAFRDPFPAQYARAMLSSLPQDAVLVALDERIARDTVLFQLSYLQSVEKFRTDVTVVNDSVARPLHLPDLRAPYGRLETPVQRRLLMEMVLNDPAFHDRQLYATFPVEPLDIGWSSYSNGVVYRVVEGGFISDTIEPEPTKLPQLPSAERQAQFALANVVSHALYAQAAFAFDHGGTEAALATLLRAMELDTLPFSQDYQDFILYRAAHTPVP